MSGPHLGPCPGSIQHCLMNCGKKEWKGDRKPALPRNTNQCLLLTWLQSHSGKVFYQQSAETAEFWMRDKYLGCCGFRGGCNCWGRLRDGATEEWVGPTEWCNVGSWRWKGTTTASGKAWFLLEREVVGPRKKKNLLKKLFIQQFVQHFLNSWSEPWSYNNEQKSCFQKVW